MWSPMGTPPLEAGGGCIGEKKQKSRGFSHISVNDLRVETAENHHGWEVEPCASQTQQAWVLPTRGCLDAVLQSPGQLVLSGGFLTFQT